MMVHDTTARFQVYQAISRSHSGSTCNTQVVSQCKLSDVVRYR